MYPCSLCICLAVSVWVLIDHEFISNILPCAVAHVCTLSFEVGGVYLAFVCCESVELCLCFCSMALTSPCATFLLQSARFTCHCWSLSDQLRLWFQLWCTICCGIILRTFTPPGSSCWAWVARVKSLASHSSSSAMNDVQCCLEAFLLVSLMLSHAANWPATAWHRLWTLCLVCKYYSGESFAKNAAQAGQWL